VKEFQVGYKKPLFKLKSLRNGSKNGSGLVLTMAFNIEN
jgi:hypothetical protein